MYKRLMNKIALALFIFSASLATYAYADDLKRSINVPAGDLETALQVLAKQTGVEFISQPDQLKGFRTRGVSGELTAQSALAKLLEGTPLIYKPYAEGAVLIALPRAPQPQSQNQPVSSQDATQTAQLEEVIVTAQKRDERLQDVPVPVTVLDASTLVATNQVRLRDYYSSIPGLSVAPGIQSIQVVSIRGINTGVATNPTVGITVDDVPYGSSASLGGGQVVPDIDPSELARIEVLRGPQGTLYGASSIGGLLKFVTVDPSTDGLHGRIEGGMSGVYSGAQLGYNARGSVNVPLSDTWAVRASGFTRLDPGYIDDPVRHIDGVNKAKAYGGRLSALWRPSEVVSLKLSALYQRTNGDGADDVDVLPGLRGLQQSYVPNTGAYTRTIQAYSATLTARLGDIDLTSVSGYNVNAFADSFDYTSLLGPYTDLQFGVTGSPVFTNNKTNKFTQEIRLSSAKNRILDWQLGAFYTHEKSQYAQTLPAENPVTGEYVGNWLDLSFPSSYTEYAGFADVTVHVTDRFDVQFGGRESYIKQSSVESSVGPYDLFFLGVPSPVLYPEVEVNNSAFTYLVTPRLKLTQDLMVYARLASGYRAGGTNVAPGVAREFAPDKTQNYELGFKGQFFDHVLSLDASLYRIDWKDIQLSLVNPQNAQGYTANGSRAKSQGIEISGQARPRKGLTVGAWVAWSDAALTEPFPSTSPVVGASGDRLPYSSRFSGNLSLEQSFSLSGPWAEFIGGACSYVGSRIGEFTTNPQRQNLPGYTKCDLRGGVRADTWTVNLFVENVTDKRGVLSGGLGAAVPYAFTYIRPRTAGVLVEKTF